MDIQDQLKADIQQAIQTLFNTAVDEVSLQPTKKEFAGTYTFVTFPLTKALRLAPAQIGQTIGAWLAEHAPVVSGFNVVQGFLNIVLNESTWVELLNTLLVHPNFGQWPARQQSVMVEYSSPNTNKPLHLGHLRNNFLGESLSRILTANGYDVVRTCIVNDRGIHICKSMLAYAQFGHDETPESSGLKGDHLVGKYYVRFENELRRQAAALLGCEQANDLSHYRDNDLLKFQLLQKTLTDLQAIGGSADADKLAKIQDELTDLRRKNTDAMRQAQALLKKWEQSDPDTINLWQKLNNWVYAGFTETYHKIGTHFDRTYYESQTYLLGKEVVEEGLATGVFYRKADNSVWIDLTAEGLDQKLVLRADGTSVYMTQDLGTTDLKFTDFHNDRSIWVVGNEQDYHFQVLFAIMRRLGRAYADGCYHLSYGMVDLPTGKMKSREGTVVDADDLIDDVAQVAAEAAEQATKGKMDEFSETEKAELFRMIGLGALKFFLLKVDSQKRMQFNPAESVDVHGHTGPFIQYSHARIRSVLRKAADAGLTSPNPVDASIDLHETEQTLIYLLSQYPQRVAEAGQDYAPSYVAQYAYEVAKAYNRLFAEVSILSEPDSAKTHLRLRLSVLTADVIRKAMGLLNIDVPEKM